MMMERESCNRLIREEKVFQGRERKKEERREGEGGGRREREQNDFHRNVFFF